MAENKGKICDAFTGGTEHALDSITGYSAGDFSFVMDPNNNICVPMRHVSEDLTEQVTDHPYIVRPNDNPAGAGVWKESQFDWEQLKDRPMDWLRSSTTEIELYSTDSVAEMQAKIDNAPHYLPHNKSLYFTFASNTTYSLTGSLVFDGFFGGGALYIRGNDSETGANTKHSTQQNHLTWSTPAQGIQILNNTCYLQIRNLKITANCGTSSNYSAIMVLNNPGWVYIHANYLITSLTTGNGYGVQLNGGVRAYVRRNYFSQGFAGVHGAAVGYGFVYDNDDIGNMPDYGVTSYNGSLLGVRDSIINGSMADNKAAVGGAINYNGAWILS